MSKIRKHSDSIFNHIQHAFENKIPFNKVLGLKVTSLSRDTAEIQFTMNKKLIGNFYRQTLHGGVISSIMDVTGGLVAFLGVLEKLQNKPMQEQIERFSKMGTIDLRVDYLRPGTGKKFVCKGYILRAGNKVAVSRCEMFNDKNELISTGTGTYIVG